MRALVLSAFLVYGLFPHCVACTRMVLADQVIHVGPSFRVKVDDHRGRPVRGLLIRVASSGVNTKGVTDADGIVSFHDLAPGQYSITAEHDIDEWPVKHLEVQSDAPRGITVPISWPQISPLLVRSLKGIVHVPNYVPGQLGPNLNLALYSAISGERLRAIQTSKTGSFNFEINTLGIYFLNLGASGVKGWDGSEVTGRIPVAVDVDARSDHLELELGWTSCGLDYIDVALCPPAQLQIGQLQGRVIGPAGAIIVKGEDLLRHAPVHIDSAGPAIPDGEIFLVDPSGNLVEHLRTDRLGEFASTQALAGSYELLVRSVGFQTFRARVFAAPNVSPSARLTIQLGDRASCSSAR